MAASDVYAATVRKWETWMAYEGPGHPGAPHGYGGPELINVIGAAWNLHTRRDALPKHRSNTESERIWRTLESNYCSVNPRTIGRVARAGPSRRRWTIKNASGSALTDTFCIKKDLLANRITAK